MGSKITKLYEMIYQKFNHNFMDYLLQLKFWIHYLFFIIIRYLFSLVKQWTFWLFLFLDGLNALSDLFFFDVPFSRESSFVIGLVGLIIAINEVNKTSEYKKIIKEEKKYIGHTSKVNKISFSSDEKMIVSSSDRVAIVWSLKTGKLIQRLQCPTWVGSAIFVNNDQSVIGIGGKGYYFSWDVSSGELLDEPKKLEKSDSVAFAVSSKENIIASAAKDGEIHVWSYPDLSLQNTFRMGIFEIRKLSFSLNDREIIGCDVTGVISKFSLSDGSSTELFSHPDKEPIRYVTYSPINNEIAFIDGAGQLYVLDLENDRLIKTKNGHTDMGLCCAFSGDGQYLATGGQDNTIIIWKKGKKKLHKLFYIAGHNGPITSLVFERKNNNLYSASRDRKIKYWKLDRLLLSNHNN